MSKRSRSFTTVITQIRIFSLNLGTSNKNFKTTKYSLEKSFQREWEYQKKKLFRNFPEKHCVVTLKDSDIEMYSTHDEGKSVIAERFIRTLKNKIYKYMNSVSKMCILIN